MLLDTHCHLDKLETVESARLAGIQRFVNVGCNIDESKLAKKFSNNHEDIFFSAGIHPNDAANVSDDYLNQLKILLKNKKCVGVGECGLDYYHNHHNHHCRFTQKLVFESQIQLAHDFKKPLIVHVRDAFDDCFELIKNTSCKKVIHCFSGDIKNANDFLNIDCYLSISGIITFDRSGEFCKIVSMIPLEKLLVETDAPYLSPIPYRGNKNESQFIQMTIKKIAEIKSLPVSEIIKKTGNNAMRIFWPQEISHKV